VARKKLQARRKQTFQPGFGWVKPLLALLTVVGSAIGLTLMLKWMEDPQQWPVGSVQIEGKFRHLQPAQLQQVVAPLAASGFFVVDVSEIQEHLQALAWVDQVSVRASGPTSWISKSGSSSRSRTGGAAASSMRAPRCSGRSRSPS